MMRNHLLLIDKFMVLGVFRAFSALEPNENGNRSDMTNAFFISVFFPPILHRDVQSVLYT